MSLSSGINEIANGADLVTVQSGTKYHNVYYFFTNSDFDKIERYRDNIGFKYYDPTLSTNEDISGFLYWQVEDYAVSANQIVEEGLSAHISAFMHNVDTYKCTLTPNDGLSTHDEPYFITTDGKTSYDDIITELSAFRCVWLSNYVVKYSNSYPSVALNISVALNGYRFDHWNLCCNDPNYVFDNKYPQGSTVEIPTDVTIYPTYVKLSRLVALPDTNLAPDISISDTISVNAIYDISTIVTLSALSCQHYHFSHWKGNAAKQLANTTLISSNVISLMLSNENNNLIAQYDKDSYRIDVEAVDCTGKYIDSIISVGNFSPLDDAISAYNILSSIHTYGTTATIVPYKTGKYNFVSWSDGDFTKSKQIVFDDNKKLSALFAKAGQIRLNLFVSPANVAIVSLSNTNGLYYSGDSAIVMTTSTNSLYSFSHWSDGSTDIVHLIPELFGNTTISAIYVDKKQIADNDDNILLFNATDMDDYITY